MEVIRGLISGTSIRTGWVRIPDDTVEVEVEAVAHGQNGDVWFDDVGLDITGDYDGSLYVNKTDMNNLLQHWDD